MSVKGAALLSVPFPLTLRNFLASGLAARLSDTGFDVRMVSPYAGESFEDQQGRRFPNQLVAARPGKGGLPEITGVRAIDRLLKSIHLSGFAIEYPDGSLQNLTLSRRRNAQWVAARALTTVAPRGSGRRRLLRRAYGRYRPRREVFSRVFDAVQPRVVLVSSPGHFWLDHFVLDEAHRRGIPTVCIMLSWDNLYSRGPLCRRPDHLLVWSDEMRRQAVEVHQFPADRLSVVGPMQFVFYSDPPTALEMTEMRRRLGLGVDDRYIAYVCGARTATYDVEDIRALVAVLKTGPFACLRVVVRPHPQGSRTEYETLRREGVLLDDTLDITGADVRPDVFDAVAARHMAALLSSADFVVSSWGTTALLEACIFDRPTVQLRWMDAVAHRDRREVQLVRDFQRYIHMRAFDAVGARLYCDEPADLPAVMARLVQECDEFRVRRRAAVERFTRLPLNRVVDRVCEVLEQISAHKRAG